MTMLASGLVLFLASHLFTTFRDLRAKAIGAVGEVGYKSIYSVAALAGFILIVMGWGQRPFIPIWYPPVWTQHLALVLMAPAMILLVSAYAPTGRIKAAVKHPMLAAIKVWAFAHLLANGDFASLLLFGGFLAFAVYDRISMKRRNDPPPTPGPASNDAIAIGVGLAAYLAFLFWLHPMLIGVAVLP